MSALTLRTARFSQPRGVCGVNRALVPPGSIVYNPAAGKVNLANGEFAAQIGKLALEYNYLGVADNGYLESDKAPRFNCPATTAFTLLAVGEFSDPAPIIGGDDAGNRCYQFRRNSGQVQFIRFNSDFSSAFTAQVSYTSGQTVFVAVSDGTAVKVYSSSGSVGTATISGTPSPVTLFAPNGVYTYDNGPNVTDRINLAALIARPLSDIEVYQLLKNPWKIFAPVDESEYFEAPVTSGTTGSGNISAVNLSAPNATAVVSSIATGNFAAVNLSTPNGTGVTASTITASGSLAAISLSAPNATAVTSAIATGSLASVSLSAPNATVSTVSATVASGSLAAISLSTPTATTVQTSIASGSLTALSLTAPTGTASTVTSVIASGNIVAINLNVPTVQPVLSVKGSGYLAPMTLIAPEHVLAPSTTVPEIVNFDTMIQRVVSFDTLITRTLSYTVER